LLSVEHTFYYEFDIKIENGKVRNSNVNWNLCMQSIVQIYKLIKGSARRGVSPHLNILPGDIDLDL
jgi:hypothetical protein